MAFRPRHLIASFSFVLMVPSLAWADPTAADKETARTLMAEARSKRDANDLKAALRSFQAADAIMHVPTTGYEVAKTESMLGLLVEARDEALTIARQPPKPGDPLPFAEARTAAQKLADELEARIPSLRVVVKNAPENVSVTIDDVVLPSVVIGLPRRLDPGSHAVIAKAGAIERRINVQVLEREAKEVPIDFGEPLPPVPNGTSTNPITTTNTSTSTSTSTSASTTPDTSRKGPWLVLGIAGIAVGGVGLAIGAVTGSMSLSQTSTIQSHCASNGACPATYMDGSTTQDTQAALNGARALALVSDIAFVAGGVIAAAGLVFIVVASTSKSHGASAELRFGPGSVMLAGRF